MPIGILFWGLFIIWIIFGGVWWRNGVSWSYGWGGNALLIMVLLAPGLKQVESLA